MRTFTLLIAIFMISISCVAQDSTQVTVDLSDFDSATVKKILDVKEKAQATKITPDKVNEWKELAVGLGDAVGEVCGAINVETNEFIKTPVGILITTVLLWKILGASILSKLMFLPLFILVLCVILWSYRRLHTGRKVKNKDADGNVIIKIDRHEFACDSDRGLSALLHAIAFCAWVGVACIVIFAV